MFVLLFYGILFSFFTQKMCGRLISIGTCYTVCTLLYMWTRETFAFENVVAPRWVILICLTSENKIPHMIHLTSFTENSVDISFSQGMNRSMCIHLWSRETFNLITGQAPYWVRLNLSLPLRTLLWGPRYLTQPTLSKSPLLPQQLYDLVKYS